MAYKSIFLVLALTIILLAPSISYSATKSEIVSSINKSVKSDWTAAQNATDIIVGGNWSSIDKYIISINANTSAMEDFYISQFGNSSFIPVVVNGTVVNGTTLPPPPPAPVEICGDGIDNDGNGLVDEGCPITPPPGPGEIPNAPGKDVNTTAILRVCSVGDIDNNNGLVTQLSLMNDYNCQIPIIPGDYAYNSASGVFTKLDNAGYTKGDTAIALGNHDNEGTTKGWTGMSNAYGTVVFDDAKTIEGINSYLAVFLIDGNDDFDCSSTQFNFMKDQIQGDEAWYKFAVVHQPFVTEKGSSAHGPNGQFACWDPLFRGNGVDAVLQAHNHNYQRFDINGLEYFVTGTGTHDTGSSMYGVDGNGLMALIA